MEVQASFCAGEEAVLDQLGQTAHREMLSPGESHVRVQAWDDR